MRKCELSKLIAELGRLTPLQRRQVAIELNAGESKATAVALIEKGVADDPQCPHCDSKTVVRNGTADRLQRFKCRDCAKTFNALIGIPLARLRMKGKWVAQAEALRDGLTLKEAAERMNVSHPTAFRWRHRFLALPKTVMANALAGIVEADETYFLESHKGSKSLPRLGRKRGGKAKQRGLSTSKDAILCTDGSRVLAASARKMGVMHRPVNLAVGIRAVSGVYHVQNVNAYDSRLKGWMQRFQGVATKYLESYLGWFRAIDRTTSGLLNPSLLLAQAAGNDLILT